MSNNKIRLRKEKIELISLIKSCSDYKKQIIGYEKQLRKSYDSNIIDRRTYEEKLRVALKEKTVKQWINYYDDLTIEYRNRVIEINKEIRAAEKTKAILPILTVAAILVMLGLSYYLIQPQITGFTVLGNVSNETIANVTNETSIFTIPIVNTINETTPIFVVPELNITEKLKEKTFEWNSSYLSKEKKDKVKEDGVYFDGRKDYEVIEGSENINLSNNTLRIEVVVKIEENSQGAIVSRYDYPNVSHLEVSIDVTGSVKFDIGDVSFSDILETNKTYNDGKYHNIIAILNKTKAQLYVDNILEVESNTTELSNINTQVPISVGANIGFIPYMHSTASNYNGIIKGVKIYYS